MGMVERFSQPSHAHRSLWACHPEQGVCPTWGFARLCLFHSVCSVYSVVPSSLLFLSSFRVFRVFRGSLSGDFSAF